ncbi:MAG TPA: hypothetical protein PLB55_25840, partial [Prosthecobacter sp.]|nr:hypothetical protein [Prosthecobacter sp.]
MKRFTQTGMCGRKGPSAKAASSIQFRPLAAYFISDHHPTRTMLKFTDKGSVTTCDGVTRRD